MRKALSALTALFLLAAPVPAPAEEEAPPLTVTGATVSAPETLGLKEAVYTGGTLLTDYRREGDLSASTPYALIPDSGLYTFRGDALRQNAAFGTCEVAEGTLTPLWEVPLSGLRTAENGMLYGVGWNNQPAVVKWAAEIREIMPLNAEFKNKKALVEVLFSAQDGKIYFLDLESGAPTRECVWAGYPLKGSVSVDPRGWPLMAFGQAVSKMPSGTGDIGYHLYDLITMQPLYFLNGRKSAEQVQYSPNGAFDSSSLFLPAAGSDALVVAGENGLLYTISLNSALTLDGSGSAVSVSPEVVYMNALAREERENKTSIEGAPSMYGRYVFLADAWGIVRCVDTSLMKTVWAYDNGDNTDAAMALDLTEEGLDLYTGNTSYSRLSKKNPVTIHRLNALTGEEIWTNEIDCVKNTSEDVAGCKASPVIGQKGLKDYVYFTVNQVRGGGAKLMCLAKADGHEVWSLAIQESVSSPVAVYSEFGDGVIFQADSRGNLYLVDGLTGHLLGQTKVDGRIEASPAVYRNRVLIGTCDKNAKMYCFEIR